MKIFLIGTPVLRINGPAAGWRWELANVDESESDWSDDGKEIEEHVFRFSCLEDSRKSLERRSDMA